MRQNIIVGIDIGSCNIHAVVAGIHRETGRLEIITGTNLPVKGMRKGIVVDQNELTESLSETISQLEKKANLSISEAQASISGSHIETKTSKGVIAISRADGEVTEEDIGRVINAAETFSLPKNRQIIHTVPQDFAVDKEMGIENPKGMTGVRLELNALIIEAFKPHIKNLNEALAKAGLKKTNLVFTPLAAATACLSRRQKELGVVIIDIGGSTTDMAIYEENVIRHAAVLPIGSSHITNDIAIAFKIPVDLAEALKIKFGSATQDNIPQDEEIDFDKFGIDEDKIDRKELSKVIEARSSEIMELVNQELRSINKEKMLPAGAVIVGGGSKLTNLINHAKKELGLPAQLGYPIEIEGLIDEVNGPDFAAAVGLIKWSRGINKKSFSLGLPKDHNYGKYLNKAKSFFKNLIP